MTLIIDVTRERFLLAIASEIDAERIQEIHFFEPIRHGGVESGVAVIAALLPVLVPGIADQPTVPLLELGMEGQAAIDGPGAPALRYTVYSAQYRLILKGVDRGRWEASVIEEADAPLVTVDAVVRGVQRRSGDVEAPERMDGESVGEIVRRSLAAVRSGPVGA